MNIETNELTKCTGCGACSCSCPVSAIKMKPDEKGFYYPSVDKELCISCEKCISVCQINGIQSRRKSVQLAFGIKHYVNSVRENSSSGGAFTLISDYILAHGGVVYGAALDNSFDVVHIRATTVYERNRMRGAKYVQSITGDIYKNVYEDLKNDLLVLFSGTPCQVAGLYAFLGYKKYSNLFTCDIFCTSVPSPLLFHEHLHVLEKKNKSSLEKYSFREKRYGWKRNDCAYFKNGKKDDRSLLSQSYYYLFIKNLIDRPSCYECNFCGSERVGDISIGDFWGADNNFRDNLGVSAVQINSDEGNALFDKIKDGCEYYSTEVELLYKNNHKSRSVENILSNVFWEDYYKNGYGYVLHKYGDCNFKGYFLFYLKKSYHYIKNLWRH